MSSNPLSSLAGQYQFRVLAEQGMTACQIAITLFVPVERVRRYAKKNDIPLRHAERHGGNRREKVKVKQIEAALRRDRIIKDAEVSGFPSLYTIEKDKCLFPVGKNEAGSWVFCGEPKSDGSSYCHHHYKKCHRIMNAEWDRRSNASIFKMIYEGKSTWYPETGLHDSINFGGSPKT